MNTKAILTALLLLASTGAQTAGARVITGAVKGNVNAVPAAAGGSALSGFHSGLNSPVLGAEISLLPALPSLTVPQAKTGAQFTGRILRAAPVLTLKASHLPAAVRTPAIKSGTLLRKFGEVQGRMAKKLPKAVSRGGMESIAATGAKLFDGALVRKGEAVAVAAHTGEIAESGLDPAYERHERVLKQLSRHRWGVFGRRAEKKTAFFSLMGAAAAAYTLAWRYLHEGVAGGLVEQAMGMFGRYFVNDFLTPIGVTAIGYLIAVGWAFARYRRMHPDERSGRLVRTAMLELPVIAAGLGMLHEIMQSPLFQSVFGFAMPGSFHPGDIIAYFLGGIAAMFMGRLLWKPFGSRASKRRNAVKPFVTGLKLLVPSVLMLWGFRLFYLSDPVYALAFLTAAAVSAPLLLWDIVQTMHQATKKIKERWLIGY
ncbi:MAG: hypothetical protein ABIJ96_00900 [Elusimicrobiota bacterium]